MCYARCSVLNFYFFIKHFKYLLTKWHMHTSVLTVLEHEINDQSISINSKYIKKYDNSSKVDDHRHAYKKYTTHTRFFIL